MNEAWIFSLCNLRYFVFLNYKYFAHHTCYIVRKLHAVAHKIPSGIPEHGAYAGTYILFQGTVRALVSSFRHVFTASNTNAFVYRTKQYNL